MNSRVEAIKNKMKNKAIELWAIFKRGSWSKSPVFWARFMAYAIPLAFLLYVLYINYLPFGYNKTFVIDVGSNDDTEIDEFYLEPSKDLSERKSGKNENGNEYTYRELNGVAYAVFKPNVVLKDAEITVSVEGEGISIIPPVIDFKPEDYEWDYSWDFTNSISQDLKGTAFMFDGEATFNGRDTRLELPNSADMFEDGPFTVYAEWTPKDSENNAQQIVGHYNWELWQNKDNVEFRVGRMNNAQGPSYSVKYDVEEDFFKAKHSAVAIYNPSENGYIDLYVDGNFAGRTYFGKDMIWEKYGSSNLSFGKSKHGGASFYSGTLGNIKMVSKNIITTNVSSIFKVSDGVRKDITIISQSMTTLNKIKLNVSQK